MALQIKVEQTFSALTAPSTGAPAAAGIPAGSAADGDSDEAGGFAATLKAKFDLSQGGFSASVSIRVGSEGQAGNGDFAAQMQGFVQTLYAALHTLFGGNQAHPNATHGTPVTTGVAAALPGAPAGTTAPAAPAADDAAASAGVPATSTPATDAPAATAAGVTGSATAAGTTAAAAPATSSASMSIRLRLTYNSFGSQMGPLTQQLAQPGAAQAAPGMADLLGDLSTRFSQLLAASPTGSGGGLSLSDFLNALAQAFSAGGANPPATVEASATPAATAPAADTVAATTPATAPATASYGQVLSFSASVHSQWLLAA